jgi:hypothetical protein
MIEEQIMMKLKGAHEKLKEAQLIVQKLGLDRTILTKWWASLPVVRGTSRRRVDLTTGGRERWKDPPHDARAESHQSQGRPA